MTDVFLGVFLSSIETVGGVTPADIAAERGHVDVLERLLPFLYAGARAKATRNARLYKRHLSVGLGGA